jgi:hypothetical protein
LLRLPRASEAAETRLVVRRRNGGERWVRMFDGRRLSSDQYLAPDNTLGERFGPLELRFRLEAVDGSLVFRQVGAAVRCGPLRAMLPRALAPRVEGCAEPAGARGARVRVKVTLPGAGLILAYDGTLEIDGDAPP